MTQRLNSLPLQLSPYVLKPEATRPEGIKGWHLFSLAGDSHTGGAFNLLTLAASTGFRTPMHIHYAEDVGIYVLEGTLLVFRGDQRLAADAGTFLFLPRATPHGFRVEAANGARILYLTVPGGFDGLTRERDFMKDTNDCTAAAARYKIEILGPVPD
jgi:quercetin dioxygenase-like cupin family protein